MEPRQNFFPSYSVEWETNGERIATISETNIYLWNVEQAELPQIASTGSLDPKSGTLHKLSILPMESTHQHKPAGD